MLTCWGSVCLSPEPTEVVERVLEDRVALVGKGKDKGKERRVGMRVS